VDHLSQDDGCVDLLVAGVNCGAGLFFFVCLLFGFLSEITLWILSTFSIYGVCLGVKHRVDNSSLQGTDLGRGEREKERERGKKRA
jgi:hypothetical protein